MKLIQASFSILSLIALLFYTQELNSQNLVDVEGTTEIRLNSTNGSPHIRLVEDDVSSGGSTRITLRHVENVNDKFEIRAFVHSASDQRMGWYYNGQPRVVYNEVDKGLGIGTSSPSEKLHVKTTGFDGIRIEGDGTGDARLWISNNAGSHYFFDDISDDNALGISSANDFKINTGGAERLRISETGDMSINATISTSRKFRLETDNKLYGMEIVNDNTGTSVGIGGEVQSTGTANKFAVRGDCGGSAGTGFSCGLYGLSSTVPALSYAVYANGDINYTGSLTNTSDRKLKKNIEQIKPVLAKVMQLRAKSYTYKHDDFPQMNLAQGTQMGFIAQEVQQIFPNLVTASAAPGALSDDGTSSENTEFLSMKYIEMIPILTKAIQEQQEIIESMKAEIQALKSK